MLGDSGLVLVQSITASSDQKPNNYIEGRLLMGGFVELQGSATSLQNSVQSVTIKTKKPSWSMSFSFPPEESNI
uniref:Uncharacterized protein n=1 Tax=Aegilops tauschii subsp. strangulata TaxID=200361 RepID=A0A453G3H3_AEGTS